MQGLAVPDNSVPEAVRVYVVTVPFEVAKGYGVPPQFNLPAGGMETVHDRWPRLVLAPAGADWESWWTTPKLFD